MKIQAKLLGFYGSTLVFVLVLFQGVTRYGDTKLVAAPNINGRYLSTEAMPGCSESTRVLLTILQSGVYLNGAVDVVENATAIETGRNELTPPLTGQLSAQQVSLQGETAALSRCQPLAQRVQVAGTVAADGDKTLGFTGTILSAGSAKPWTVKALRLVESRQKEEY
ncbi:MAG: hypothetical protein HC781_13200 [Leptolyngbyaceae cyanobacterium CSU_1_4]|nr:hypothetical protein [Leptolyngbyaceae cyanobacterium CSU_1_4]